MTVPARLFTGEGHFVGETWMAGLRPILAYFVPSLLISRLSFSYHVSPELVRIQMFGRGCTEADENRITCSELETVVEAGETRCYGTRREESRTSGGEETPLFISFHEM